MDEARWLAAKNPLHPLMHVRRALKATRTNAGKRKLRLFGCACARRAWPALGDADRRLVEAAEQFADGAIPRSALRNATRGPRGGAWSRLRRMFRTTPPRDVVTLFGLAADAAWPAASVWRAVSDPRATYGTTLVTEKAEKAAQAALVRCLFGNPFRPLVFPKAWRTPTAVALAEAAYADHAFDRLPVLADALEEAGCDDPGVLAHCREPAAHARGCWVVDAVLGHTQG